MGDPKQVNALIRTEDSSIWANRGKSSLKHIGYTVAVPNLAAQMVAVSGHLQAAIDAVEASDVDAINGAAGFLNLLGVGTVSVSTVGQDITVSGTPHTLPGGNDYEFQYKDGVNFVGSPEFYYDSGSDILMVPNGSASLPGVHFNGALGGGFAWASGALHLIIGYSPWMSADEGSGIIYFHVPVTLNGGDLDANGQNISNVATLGANTVNAAGGAFTSSLTVSGVPVDIGGITTDHGALSGLGDDDHPQYGQLSDNETASGTWNFANGLTVSGVAVDIVGGGVTAHGALTGLGNDDHPQYMKDLVEDASPQLGGNLDAQSNDITSVNALTAVTGTFTSGLSVGTGTMSIYPDEIHLGGHIEANGEDIMNVGTVQGYQCGFSSTVLGQDVMAIDALNSQTPFTPVNTADPAGAVGDIRWDMGNIYVKTPIGWLKAALVPF
jgi:hypothetical protein